MLYSKLCLWFDEVKPNLKLVLMSVNTPLPSKRPGFCMWLAIYCANVFNFRDSLRYLNIHKLLLMDTKYVEFCCLKY